MNQVNITDAAYSRVKEIISDDPALAGIKLRIFVQGGGCSGFEYGFTFYQEQNEDDWDFEQEGIKILIDTMSMQYLAGAVIDYKDDLDGSRFVIENPNAQSTCGCGSSFSPSM